MQSAEQLPMSGTIDGSCVGRISFAFPSGVGSRQFDLTFDPQTLAATGTLTEVGLTCTTTFNVEMQLTRAT
jgi:hypothetical protein